MQNAIYIYESILRAVGSWAKIFDWNVKKVKWIQYERNEDSIGLRRRCEFENRIESFAFCILHCECFGTSVGACVYVRAAGAVSWGLPCVSECAEGPPRPEQGTAPHGVRPKPVLVEYLHHHHHTTYKYDSLCSMFSEHYVTVVTTYTII